MTSQDAKQLSPLLNAIVATATVLPVLRGEGAIADTTRMLQHHVSQLRQKMDSQRAAE